MMRYLGDVRKMELSPFKKVYSTRGKISVQGLRSSITQIPWRFLQFRDFINANCILEKVKVYPPIEE